MPEAPTIRAIPKGHHADTANEHRPGARLVTRKAWLRPRRSINGNQDDETKGWARYIVASTPLIIVLEEVWVGGRAARPSETSSCRLIASS
jgi:hypothetical protein